MWRDVLLLGDWLGGSVGLRNGGVCLKPVLLTRLCIAAVELLACGKLTELDFGRLGWVILGLEMGLLDFTLPTIRARLPGASFF